MITEFRPEENEKKRTSLLKCWVLVIKLGKRLLCRPALSGESFLFLLGALMNKGVMGLSHSAETSEDPEVLQGMSETRFDYWEGGEEPERADMDLKGKYTEEVNSHTRNR